VKIRASTLNFLNFWGLSNIIFIHPARENQSLNPQLSQLFQPLYSVSKINKINWKKLRKLRVEAIILFGGMNKNYIK
jgi:hypothetical protein